MVPRFFLAILAACFLVAPAWAQEEAAPAKPEPAATGVSGDAEAPGAEDPAPAEPEPAARPLTPYYNFGLTEGLSLPSIGNFFFGSNLESTLGGQVAIAPEHSASGVYTIEYSGPGIRSEDDREFAERTLDHQVGLGHQWKITDRCDLKTRLAFLNEYRRTGANEPFGQGLYDFWSFGVEEEFAARAGYGVVAGLGLGLSWVGFPNYTDLLNEFQMAGTGAETAGGQQDYTRFQVSPEARYKDAGRMWVSWSLQSFRNAKVLTEQGTYGSETQADSTLGIGGTWKFRLTPSESRFPGVVAADPQLDVSIKNSNQNFLRFAGFGAATFDFVPDYYSYTKYDFKAPVRWAFEGGTAMFFVPGLIYKRYASRPPRNADGTYQHEGNNPNQPAKQQWNQTLLLSWGVSFPTHRFAAWTLAYTWHLQKSNNHFEKYLPSNFSGHLISLGLNIGY